MIYSLTHKILPLKYNVVLILKRRVNIMQEFLRLLMTTQQKFAFTNRSLFITISTKQCPATALKAISCLSKKCSFHEPIFPSQNVDVPQIISSAIFFALFPE